ncbi:hypothetical protein AB0L14_13055 [Streptomyces sp. NPDC052727]|uniref:hypothetical protein n=1 Tax=Streptomyces sp. NPDC052727 TaxID=3154854 RepID=UPI0034255371
MRARPECRATADLGGGVAQPRGDGRQQRGGRGTPAGQLRAGLGQGADPLFVVGMVREQAEGEVGGRSGEESGGPVVDALDPGLHRAAVAPERDTGIPYRVQQQVQPARGQPRIGRREGVHGGQPELGLRGVEQVAQETAGLVGVRSGRFARGRPAEGEDEVQPGHRIVLRPPAPQQRGQGQLTRAGAGPHHVGGGAPDHGVGIVQQREYGGQRRLPRRRPAGVQGPVGDLPGLVRQHGHQFQQAAPARHVRPGGHRRSRNGSAAGAAEQIQPPWWRSRLSSSDDASSASSGSGPAHRRNRSGTSAADP